MKICVYLFIELAVQYNLTYKNNTIFEFGIQTNNFFQFYNFFPIFMYQ